MYVARLYDKYIHEHRLNIYGSERIPLPFPRMVVFYNGKKDIEDETLELKDAFRAGVKKQGCQVNGEAGCFTEDAADIEEYAATSMNVNTKDEIFSAMLVYGFLSFEKGKVAILNKELMDKFEDMLRKETSLGYVHRLAKNSRKMLEATINGDTDTMEQILEYAHDTETPKKYYNNEAELSAIVKLMYLSARDYYRIEREEDAGKGYVDFIFYPETNRSADCIILELKVNHSAEEAIRQIITKCYALRFAPRPGEQPRYTGRILAVGIACDQNSKKHSCKIEILDQDSIYPGYQ